MKPNMFFHYKVGEDPQEFVKEIQKIIYVMEVTSKEKVELATYHFKGVDHV